MTQSDIFSLPPGPWSELRRLLDVALELPADERSRFVDGLDGAQARWVEPLRRLLQHGERGVDLLDTLPKVETADFAGLAPGLAADWSAGALVGPYRLRQALGRGGMASVWLAERTDMLQRRAVALKLPHAAALRPGWAERLAREREILAALDHPHIARLYDAGVTPVGQPYLALEHVDGRRIDEHANARDLDLRARLRLLLQAARAVAHAHAQLVVHRDLKPSNMLVNPAGELKLLDFGVAKLLDDGPRGISDATALGGAAMTLPYAAPEQVQGGVVGTASDIYSLGVVAFELLTGTRPYRLTRPTAAALEEAIAAGDVPRASSVAPPPLRKALRGEVDAVLAKALAFEPARRYPTADAFADDLQRLLDDRPVAARPESGWYRLSKFARRHRVGVGLAAGTTLALLGGVAVALWQADRARDAQRRAEEVKAFIAAIFEDASPWVGAQGKPSATELLLRARERIDRHFADRPEQRLELRGVLGASLAGVQEHAAAEPLLRETIAEGQQRLGADHPLVVGARMWLLEVLQGAERPDELEAELRAVQPLLEAAAPRFASERIVAQLKAVAASNMRGRYPEMEAQARRALALIDEGAAILSDAKLLRMRAWQGLANALENQKRAADSVDYARRSYEGARELYADQPRHPELTTVRFVYARILHHAGQSAASLPLFEQAIADTEATFGTDSLRVGTMLRTQVAPLLALNRYADALASSDRAVRILRAHHGDDDLPLAYARVARGSIHAALGDPASAFADYDQALGTLVRVMGAQAPYTLHVQAHRAGALAQRGEVAQAVAELAQTVEAQRPHGPMGFATTVLHHVMALRLNGQPAQALAALQRDATVASSRSDRFRWHYERGASLLDLARNDEALAALRQAETFLAAPAETSNAPRAEWRVALGRALLQQGDADAARVQFDAALAYWRTREAQPPAAAEARRWAARARLAAAQPPRGSRPAARGRLNPAAPG